MRQAIRKCGLVVLALGLVLSAAHAEDYPTRPIRVILPVPPGGGMDAAARIVGEKLGDILGQQVAIEYRPGASGVIGAQLVAKAAPDGYTLLFYDDDLFTIPSLMPQMTFDPNKELLPIAALSNTPLVIVTAAKGPFASMKQLLDAARASAAGLTYATPGLSVNHVAAQWIAVETHVKLLPVPYRGGADSVLAIISGVVPFGILSPAAVYPGFVDAGKIKVIALTSQQRPGFVPPAWPTMTDSGLPVDVSLRLGLFGPVGLPQPIVARLDRALDQVLQDEAVRKRMTATGINPEHIGQAAFIARIHADAERYEQIIRATGIHTGN